VKILLQLLQLNVQRLWDPPIVEEEFVRYIMLHLARVLYEIITTIIIIIRVPILATQADRFSRCCWRRFSRFLACPLTLPPVPASHCLSSLLHAVAAA